MTISRRVSVQSLKANSLSFYQSQVQNMMTSKYIAFFLTEVSEWQKKLSTADQVISTYMEVQRTWSHLESIFIGSEDIRSQLPEDSKRFDSIDVKFKVRLWICFFYYTRKDLTRLTSNSRYDYRLKNKQIILEKS